MEVRTATSRDALTIAETNVVSWKASNRGHIPDDRMEKLNETIKERAEYWARVVARKDPGEVVLVAEDSGKVIGFVHVLPSRDPFASKGTAEITTIFVRPQHWGEGAGRGLLTEALEKLRRARFSQVTLWVVDVNARARRFYEIAGFKSDGTSKTSEFEGVSLIEVRYTLNL